MLHTLFVIKVKEFANVLSPFVLFYFQQDLFCHIPLVSFTSVIQLLLQLLFSFANLSLLPTKQKTVRFCIRVLHLFIFSLFASFRFYLLLLPVRFPFPSLITAFALFCSSLYLLPASLFFSLSLLSFSNCNIFYT